MAYSSSFATGFGSPFSSVPDYSGAFSEEFNFSYPTKSSGLGSRLGGGNMFGAILGGGLSLFGNMMAARAQASAAQAQMAASADQLKNNIMMNREARKGNLAKFIGQNVADYGYGGDLDFERQKRGAIFDKTRGRDLDRAASFADARQMLGLQMDPMAREMRQGAMRRRIQEETAKRQAEMRGMYGPIA